jgi:thiol:disulfide interchange protein DsbD
MRHLLVLLTSILFSTTLFSQTLDPVKWKATIEKETDDTYILYFEATLDEGWHLYSQHEADSDEIAPTPTEFTYNTTA